MKKLAQLLILIALITACQPSDKSDKDLINIALTPGNVEAGGLRWSPKGEKLILTKTDAGWLTQLPLGPDKMTFGLRLSSSDVAGNLNILEIDGNRNGFFGEEQDSILTCEPSERRGKIWSSFSTTLQIPFSGADEELVVNPYPISFWYVFDPETEEAEEVIRYSRRGWMEGQSKSEGEIIHVLVTESLMDGIIDEYDSWSIAADSAYKDLFLSQNARSIGEHAWLGEVAYGIDSVSPSGRNAWIKKVDPQITREEEEAANDWLAPDREAKHSGDTVAFLHDYSYAMELAKQRAVAVLLDFETTWCGPCKTMDKWVYTADTVVTVSKNLICVKIDGDEHKDLVKKYAVTGYPTLIVLNKAGEVVARASGYQSVEKTLAMLKLAIK